MLGEFQAMNGPESESQIENRGEERRGEERKIVTEWARARRLLWAGRLRWKDVEEHEEGKEEQ
jgi:hypothetical protein